MSESKQLHFKLYKPVGMLSQLTSNDPKEMRSKSFLSELFDFPKSIMPVGRLDEKSEGLLLMTTDGQLSDKINRSGVEKEYLAQLDGIIGQKDLDRLQNGVEIGFKGLRYLTKPCQVKLLIPEPMVSPPHASLRIGRHRPTSWISICLKEGKYRQVRKMTAAVGYPVQRLIRIRIGQIRLHDMAPGQVKEIMNLN